MKPPSPPPQAENNLDDTEQTLLKAARDFQQAKPSPAMDAAILRAATQHATEIRKTQAESTASASAPQRLSRWLFGNAATGGRLWLTAAASVFVVTFGLMALFGNNIRALFGSSINALTGEAAYAPQMMQHSEQAATPKPTEKIQLETEIETELKQLLQLRRAGKEEEAQVLLRQLRERYPNDNIDERLRQLEKEENNEGASPSSYNHEKIHLLLCAGPR